MSWHYFVDKLPMVPWAWCLTTFSANGEANCGLARLLRGLKKLGENQNPMVWYINTYIYHKIKAFM